MSCKRGMHFSSYSIVYPKTPILIIKAPMSGFPPPENYKSRLEELIDSSLTFSARLALRSVTGFASHQDCLEEFNKYVHGPLRDAVVADLGDVTDVPYTVSCNLFLRIVSAPLAAFVRHSSLNFFEMLEEQLRSVCWQCCPGPCLLLLLLGSQGLNFMRSAIDQTSSMGP